MTKQEYFLAFALKHGLNEKEAAFIPASAQHLARLDDCSEYSAILMMMAHEEIAEVYVNAIRKSALEAA